ncbi:GspE/PulE family protein [Tuwongella immobilis]|uniref:Bacterial type II secretion system protein E domain-containing protein n=1 Tax=Tuwongella immobilis TaxID=692036 RepID=A0A6C2YSQ9_9BACT|nr:ATPase, T2SS/T4P/T4SS family [Tuwongella immobilis]VIP04411.1 general secretion pathway protein e : Type II secretion system protein E OS=Pirellula staleyi (strain ATCC 27377 / DSM 6068 / ICPB 4128) GN=Psta_3673 PE=4 SV=1: T2SE_Nter: T2SE [Tuwongella immobilis]VTS06184.1 general secretion pathway protein e : Type II secretion system protein E OS=Pirellula staleyi (strain ATCC 27377 / DSM 6068 / ICPB 4128) GN=Psta_3673 PE=4 SV=1: T2SE_Nter: T2SE [Tuwongella immobilis]
MSLLDQLREKNLISDVDVPRAVEALSTAGNRSPLEILVERGFVREEPMMNMLAEEFGLEWVDLTQVEVSPQALASMPHKLVHRRGLMPLARENGTLTVATGDPYDVNALDELQTLTGLQIYPVLASPREIARLIKTHFGVGGETVSALVQEKEGVELLEDVEADDSELAKQAQEASVVKLVNEILLEAINERASDIHIEPEETGLRIRYRIDGILQSQKLPEGIMRFQNAIISRIKIMSRLNIAEKRLPQDGRIKMRVSGREVDVRVSIIPMIHGEGIVMRLLDKGRMVFNLSSVGMMSDIYQTFKVLIDRPHGIVLVTGPTGSGKSTTLYSALNEIKDEATKIITVEDPVEYQQPGISQIQVHSKIGLTFAASLRSILRHDPDVILIGEMRDMETAQSAIQASLTGHLVFSTLHTNDSPSAFTRLIDMGIEPFLVASTVEGIMAQRLVRTICRDCKTEYHHETNDLPVDFPGAKDPGTIKLWKGAGCRACRQSGYRGRTGIHELLVSNDVIKELVVQRVNAGAIRMEAMRMGLITLRQDGWRKVLTGQTTVEEVGRVTAGDLS